MAYGSPLTLPPHAWITSRSTPRSSRGIFYVSLLTFPLPLLYLGFSFRIGLSWPCSGPTPSDKYNIGFGIAMLVLMLYCLLCQGPHPWLRVLPFNVILYTTCVVVLNVLAGLAFWKMVTPCKELERECVKKGITVFRYDGKRCTFETPATHQVRDALVEGLSEAVGMLVERRGGSFGREKPKSWSKDETRRFAVDIVMLIMFPCWFLSTFVMW